MPWSARLLELGGIGLFWGAKLLLVATAAAALLLAARWVQPERRYSQIMFRLALVSVQAAAIGLAGVSLNNAVVLGST